MFLKELGQAFSPLMRYLLKFDNIEHFFKLKILIRLIKISNVNLPFTLSEEHNFSMIKLQEIEIRYPSELLLCKSPSAISKHVLYIVRSYKA